MRTLYPMSLTATLALALTGPTHAAESLELPDGFTATVVHEGVGSARHIAVRDNGDVWVMRKPPLFGPDDGEDMHGIVVLRDSNGDGTFDEQRTFTDMAGTGIAFHDDAVYVSDDDAVYRYALGDDEPVPTGSRETIVSGFPEQDQHADKTFALDGAGNLFVNVGAPSNACQREPRTPGSPGLRPCPQLERQAGIWRFDATRTGQTQQDDGERYATGVRNAVALAWNDGVGALYAVVHGRDQMDFLFPDLFDAEFNARRVAEEMFRIDEGGDYGWPYTFYDPVDGRRLVAPEYGGDGEQTAEAGEYPDPLIAFPGHWAPNDLAFYDGDMFPERYRGGAFVAFHGSWNRAPLPQAGYNVSFVPMGGDGRPSGDRSVFADGFAGGEIENPLDADARPMGLAVAPDGALYVVDSQQGRVWRITY